MKRYFVILFAALWAFSCKEDIPLDGARVSPTSLVMSEGTEPRQIYLYLYPTYTTQPGVKWVSEHEEIASVNAEGMVTPLLPGETVVSVYSGDRKLASCEVTVTPIVYVSMVELDKSTMTCAVGAPGLKLTATITPADATNPNVIWSSNPEEFVKVDGQGNLTALAVGTATVTVTTVEGGHTASCIVTVEAALAKGPNLLVNPGFEEPDNNVAATITPWVNMDRDLLLLDDPDIITGYNNANRTDAAYWTSNPLLTPHGGTYSGRLGAGANSGMYQLVDVTPGKTYEFKAYILHFRTNTTNQSIIKEEAVRIKNEDGSATLETVPIGTDENTWLEVTGSVTIPAGVTKIRLQISHHDAAIPLKSPGTLIDDCEFCEVM